MPRQAKLIINNCKECPHFKIGTSYSFDGWDRGSDWICKKADKKLAVFVEWPRDEPKEIPEWCPLLEKKKAKKKTKKKAAKKKAKR